MVDVWNEWKVAVNDFICYYSVVHSVNLDGCGLHQLESTAGSLPSAQSRRLILQTHQNWTVDFCEQRYGSVAQCAANTFAAFALGVFNVGGF